MSLDLNAALTGTLRRMHSVQRYSSVPVIRSENVAEHSWQMVMICYLIGHDLINQGVKLDMGKLLSRAAVHDVSETLSGDIIRSYKHSSESMEEACHHADIINMRKFVAEIDPDVHSRPGKMLEMNWRRAKDDDLEGQIVKLADLLCVVSYCVAENALGNRAINFVLKGMYEDDLHPWHNHELLGVYVDKLFPTRNWFDPYGGNE
jgi:5'-deoxynucleotidase